MSPVVIVFLSTLTITSYRSVRSQTDDSPYFTSIGYRVSETGVAVSQDLLESGKINYGDALLVEGVGIKMVTDTMAPRHRNHVDVWVPNYDAEKQFEKQFRGKKVRVWVIKQRKSEAKSGRGSGKEK